MRSLSISLWGLILCLIFCVEVFAQTKMPESALTIDVVDTSLGEVLTRIAMQSGISFSYNPKRIDATQKITFKAIAKTLTEVLEGLTQQVSLSYAFVENQIVLKPDRRTEKTVAQTATLSGFVRDASSGEALIGATVILKELQTGTASNAFGFYSITVPKGSYTISYSFIGFKEQVTSVELKSAVQRDAGLLEEPPVLQPIVVNSATPDDVAVEIQASKNSLRPNAVEQRPALFGEVDVVKSLESIPGIKMHSEGSTFYYVRGGNRDQNLVLIDDAPIYNPSHLLGFFSTIIPDAVNDINVYKGDMPASLGGRLSSVLDVRTKKGNDQHLQVWGNAGLISTKLGIEGPLKRNASSFLISGRFSRLKWIFQQIDKNITAFNFYDFTGKLNFKLSPKNNIYFSFYTGSDDYFGTNNGIAWSNSAGSVRWNQLISNRLFLNTTLAVGSYDYSLYTDVASNSRWKSHISNVSLKTDFSYFVRPQNEITFGLTLNRYNFNPGNFLTGAAGTQLSNVSVKNSTELVLYANHEITLDKHWGLNYGLRLSSWSNAGAAFEFIFDKNRNTVDTLSFRQGQSYSTYVNAEPRFTVRYLLDEKSSFKTTFSRNIQNVHLITNSISPFTSLDVWLPSSINIKPQAADQVTLGYYRSLTGTGVSFVAETFYKKMYNQIDYEAHASILLNPAMERDLRFGEATAYGLEMQIKKDEGRLRGWLGYTYSRAQRQFADINGGKTFNAFYDRPHQVNLVLSYDISVRWNLGANWNFSTGAPFTSPIGFYSFNGQEVPLYGQKNNDRLPAYHRLDVSATLMLNKNPEKKFHHSLTFSIYNLYGRKNAMFINYNKVEVSAGNFSIPSNLLESYRQTSQYYLFSVVPSISYNFKWL